jgi:hypothetical protein
VNLLADNRDTTNKNPETLIDASNIGPEVNIEKNKYMLVSHEQNGDQIGI